MALSLPHTFSGRFLGGKGDSLVPRPLPDSISQPWRKLGEGLLSILHHGPEMVDSVSDGKVPAHAICGQYSRRLNSKACLGVSSTGTDFASTKSLTNDM